MHFYPANLFEPDPTTKSARPFIVFTVSEIQSNLDKMKSWDDEVTTLAPKDVFALPVPSGGLIDSSQNQYDNNPSLLAGAVNAVASGKENMMSQALGVVPDPKFTQVYMGSTPRTWTGSWQLIASSRAESESIVGILKLLKQAAAPDKADIKNKIGILIQPWVLEVYFYPEYFNDMMKFDKMAIESYTIDYFAQGYASTYHDNTPKQISLTITLKEYGVKTRKDWMEG